MNKQGKKIDQLTVRGIKARVVAIESLAETDDESAHAARDTLWHNVLLAIADGVPHPERLAAEALKVEKIDFREWCG